MICCDCRNFSMSVVFSDDVIMTLLTIDHVMQSQQDTITPFQILGGESQVVQVDCFFKNSVIFTFCAIYLLTSSTICSSVGR